MLGCIGLEQRRVMFIECKRKKKDRMRPSQAKWLDSALKAGRSGN